MKKLLSSPIVNKYVIPGLTVLFAAVFLVTAGLTADYLIKSHKHKKMMDSLAQMMQQDNSGTDNIDDYTDAVIDETFTLPEDSKFTKVVHPKTNKTLLIQTEYVELFKLNPDLIGWIYIDGTEINYPVMQTPEWVNYYLKRDFYGQSDDHGSIYADEMADIKRPSANVTLYGHKMKDGSMFAGLMDYKEKSFYEQHPTIDFNTIYKDGTYEIIAVFITTANEGGFPYHLFVDGTEEEFDAFVSKCKELSLYDTGVDAEYGDKLITLSTCEHNVSNGRFVVVAKKVS